MTIGGRIRRALVRREIDERKRSATWQVSIALITATLGAAGLGYLAVQLFFLPETVALARLNRVPDLTGLDLEDAVRAGAASGYPVAESGRQHSEEHGEGDVIYQVPPPDSYLAQGDTVWVQVSLGESEPVVPDLAGVEPEVAHRILLQLGVEVTPARRAASDIHPQNTVIETVPPAGTPIRSDTRVTLVLSRGGTFLEMPNVEGLSLAEARDTLELYSLTVGEVTGMADPQLAGEGSVVVVDQDPGPRRRVRSGSAVRLQLGEAPRPRAGLQRPPRREPLPPPGAAETAETAEVVEEEAEPRPDEEAPGEFPMDEAPVSAPPDTAQGEGDLQ